MDHEYAYDLISPSSDISFNKKKVKKKNTTLMAM